MAADVDWWQSCRVARGVYFYTYLCTFRHVFQYIPLRFTAHLDVCAFRVQKELSAR